jgi:transglutaminase-like putative cysteine protease
MFQEKAPSHALIGLMRESHWTLRSIASVVILSFGGLVTSPAVAAVKQEIKEIQWHKADSTNAAKLSAKVEEAHQVLTKLASRNLKDMDVSASHAQVHALKADLEALDKGAMDDFAANETHIKAHKLPEVIEQRQQAAVKTYRDRMDTLMAELKAADDAKDSATFMAHVNKAKEHLDKVQVKPFHEKFDPKNLPFSVAKPTGVKPRLTKKDYQARPVAPAKRAQVAANGPLAGILTAADLTGTLPTNPSDPSYVAATDDAQITPAIQAKAAALHNDPVQIYNWVHNNVEYVPTYGSIQGSDMTLQTLKGNDFDQASLLIALLRAANIPSRYVYGTIQVPIAQVENWVGGVTDPNAALNLMSQGGIPVTGLVQGGQIKYGQLEHVWVEAWVNFVPSRAAKSGAGNTWVPMDASFKQYAYVQGMNLAQAVPFDSAGLVQQLANSTTYDSTGAGISNVNQNLITQQLTNFDAQAAVAASNLPATTTVEQVTGGKSVIKNSITMLNASLPYRVEVVGSRSAALTQNLRYEFQIEIDDPSGSPIISYMTGTTDLSADVITLEFQPATSADAQLFLSYINQNGEFQPPSSLPGYLFSVVPVLAANGVTLATGSNPVQLGASLQVQKGYVVPGTGWEPTDKTATAGGLYVIGIDLQGIAPAKIQNLLTQAASIEAAIGNSTGSYTTQDFVSTTLAIGLLSYFKQNDSKNESTAGLADVVPVRMPSFGTYFTVAQPLYSFGVPTSVTYPGVTMDIESFRDNVVSKIDSHDEVIQYFRMTGLRYSALESAVPSQMFSEPGVPVTGVSTVTALTLAMSSGQTVFHIDSTNAANVLPLLNVDSGILDEISGAVQSGKEVTIPQTDVIDSGWTGIGYVIFDPQTGSGAYEIDGGANGGFAKIGDSFGYESTFGDYLGDVESGTNTLDALSFTVGIGEVAVACANDPAAMFRALMDYVWIKLLIIAMQTFIEAVLASLIAATGGLAVFAIAYVMGKLEEKMLQQAERSDGCAGSG